MSHPMSTDLLPNIAERLRRWKKHAELMDWHFEVSVIDDRHIEVSPITLPKRVQLPYFKPIDSKEDTHKRLISMRMIQLANLGRNYGVFRPVERVAKYDNCVFSAYDLPPPPIPKEMIAERYHDLVHGQR